MSDKKPIDEPIADPSKVFDGLLRRMLSTPPKPHPKQEKKKIGQ